MPFCSTLISTTAELADFLSWIPPASSLYIDLEGRQLGRYGTITFMAVLVYPEQVTKVIDVQTLGGATFTTPSNSGATLGWILENPYIQKGLWDVRGDADALWALYRIGLSGVVDIQLLENYARPGDKTYLCGLAKAIYDDGPLHEAERAVWWQLKRAFKQRMVETDIFAVRPVSLATLQYCVHDVVYLPHLHAHYLRQLPANVWCFESIMWATMVRLNLVRLPEYQPHTASHRYGPWAFYLGTGDGSQWFF